MCCKADEELHELVKDRFAIIQKKQGFRFGTDAVLLADFIKAAPRMKLIDFGFGTGVIALLTAIHHPDARVCGVELQADMAEMAHRSVELNALNDRVDLRQGDIRAAARIFGYGIFDRVSCNPPYFEPASSIRPDTDSKLVSRMLTDISLDEICKSAFEVLKSGGRLSVVYPASRIDEMLFAMRQNRLSPKRIRAVQLTASKAPKLMLLDAVKQGGSGLDWLPPLILQNDDGSHSAEWHRIYD